MNPRLRELIAAGATTGASTLIRTSSGIIINKLIAINCGPAGFALVSQFQNLLNLGTNLASVGGTNGIILIENRGDINEKNNLRRIVVLSALLIAAAIAPAYHFIGTKIFHPLSASFYGYGILALLVAGTIASSLSGTSVSLNAANGRSSIVLLSNVLNSFSLLVLGLLLIPAFGVVGYVASISLSPLLSLSVVGRKNLFSSSALGNGEIRNIDLGIIRTLITHSWMVIISSASNLAGQTTIRLMLAAFLTTSAAGLWDSVTKISALVWGIFNAMLSMTLLRQLANCKTNRDLVKKTQRYAVVVLPVYFCVATLVYWLREPVIRLAFTAEFQDATNYIGYQLLGDSLRVATWFYIFPLIAKEKFLVYSYVEVFTNVCSVAVTYFLFPIYGLLAPFISHAITYGSLLLALTATYLNQSRKEQWHRAPLMVTNE
jgi:PST family polysaccharide transporter